MEFTDSSLLASVEFAGTNNVHPLGLAALLCAAGAVLTIRRTLVPTVVLLVAAFIPSSQRIVIGGADFNFVRALVLVGIVRELARGEHRWVRLNIIDAFVVLGALSRLICSPIAAGSTSALVAAIGANFELFGLYFILRCSIRELGEAKQLVLHGALITAAVLPFFLLERATGRNLFSVFGGVPEITHVREGRLRCQGAISHAILAGCFFVAWLPLWVAFSVAGIGRTKLLGIIGIVASTAIVVCCASSTPAVALLLGCAVWIAFPLRGHLRLIYLSLIGIGIVLHLVMSKPIWHLISRIDLVGGSTGYHRYRLIDAAINRVGEWWMIGTQSTFHWGFGLYDVTNQFVLEAVRGGIWALLAMCGVLVFGYATVGKELRRLAALRAFAVKSGALAVVPRIRADEAFVYGLGAALCAQMAIFLAVSYFGQTTVVWQFFMALVACMRQWSTTPSAAAALESRQRPRSATREKSLHDIGESKSRMEPRA